MSINDNNYPKIHILPCLEDQAEEQAESSDLNDDLRLIANPLHLSDVKVIKNDIKRRL